MNLVSPNSTRNHLHKLAEEGYIRLEAKQARAIALVHPAPTAGREGGRNERAELTATCTRGLASARFDLADAVEVDTRNSETWAVYLDASLSRWEVFIDAPNGRVFVSEDTWDSLDGPALGAVR